MRLRLQMVLVRAIVLYATPIWGKAMTVYRRSALRIISELRTVSTYTTLLIAGTIPVHIAVEKEGRKHLLRGQTELNQLEFLAVNNW